MKSVLHVLASLERSGMEIMLLCSYQEWLRSGYSCDVVGTYPQIGPLAGDLAVAGYGIRHIPFRSKSRYLPRLRFLKDFYRLCKSGYDVVHIHTEMGTPAMAAIARLAGVRRIVLTPHSVFPFQGILRVRKRLERLFNRCLGGRYGMISDGVLKCEWEKFRNRGVRTWSWLDTAYFRPPSAPEREAARRSLGCMSGQFVIASVGNCAEVKNHTGILRALPLLPPSIDFLYLHVGKEQPGRPETALAAELGVDHKVRFLGSQGAPRSFLWAADVFVMPSLREGLGISALEAIASGVPVVLTNRGGLRDIAAETQWAISIATDAEAIREGIAQVAVVPEEERRRRALQDSKCIRERFSIENGVRSIVRGIYQSAKCAD